jgi:hypothetical protein
MPRLLRLNPRFVDIQMKEMEVAMFPTLLENIFPGIDLCDSIK